MEHRLAPELREFITASKSKGASDEFLVALLTRQGWPTDDMYAALGEYWSGVTGLAVPAKGASGGSASEAFYYLLAFATLGAWTTAMGSAMFTFIDGWFPDAVSPAAYSLYTRRSVTWQMATILVAYPIFLLVTRMILREDAAHPEQQHSGVRKWLTYFALLITAGIMIGDLIWFLDHLLSGEITIRFLMRSAVVLVICGAIFLFYLRPLQARRSERSDTAPRWNRTFALVSVAAVVAVFVIGLVVAGTPGEIRQQQADTRRKEGLRRIGYAIRSRWESQANRGQPTALPNSLQDLIRESRERASEMRDPVTEVEYEYRPLGDTRYELCANFAKATGVDRFDPDLAGFWRHPAGRTCFALDVSKPVP